MSATNNEPNEPSWLNESNLLANYTNNQTLNEIGEFEKSPEFNEINIIMTVVIFGGILFPFLVWFVLFIIKIINNYIKCANNRRRSEVDSDILNY